MIEGLLLHSVSYAGLWGQAYLDVDACIAKAAELGFDGVMLMAKRPHVSVLDYSPRRRAALRRRLEQSGMRHVVIAGYNNLTADLEHGEIPNLEIQTTYILALAQLAKDLGAQLVRLFTGYEHPAVDFARQWTLIRATLKECAQRAAELGVTLGVQNHHDLAVGYEAMHDLIQSIGEPNCRALFDAWAPALQGEDLGRAAAQMATITAHTTVADYRLRPRYRYNPALVNYEKLTPNVIAVPMGTGLIDYRAFFAALLENGFSGTVAYEMCSPLADGGDLATLDSYARVFVEWMRANFLPSGAK